MFRKGIKQSIGAALLLTCLFASPSRALAADASVATLAAVILGSFPYALADGTSAMAGNDWCLQVETDPTLNWWAFQPTTDGSQMAFNATRDAARIKLIFKSKKDSSYGFASIFIALDNAGDQQQPYQNGKFNLLGASSNSPDPPAPKIALPNNMPPGCMTAQQFLTALLPAGINVQDSATCKVDSDDTANGGCGKTNVTVNGAVTPIRNKLVATATEANSNLFWNFNGRAHRIAGAFRILVTVPLVNGTLVPAYLTIGYGGNSGAG